MTLDIAVGKVLHDNNSQCEFLFELVTHCPMLGELNADKTSLTSEERTKVGFALACNRARYRAGFLSKDEGSRGLAQKQWPHALEHASIAFRLYHDDDDDDESGIRSFFYAYVRSDFRFNYKATQPDSIYQLLVDFRESFVGMLVNRKSKDVLKGSSGTTHHQHH
jgi:hypothetical protein